MPPEGPPPNSQRVLSLWRKSGSCPASPSRVPEDGFEVRRFLERGPRKARRGRDRRTHSEKHDVDLRTRRQHCPCLGKGPLTQASASSCELSIYLQSGQKGGLPQRQAWRMSPHWSRSHLEPDNRKARLGSAECKAVVVGSPQWVPLPRLTGTHILEAEFRGTHERVAGASL